jgi:hypothetical protein
VAGFRSQSRRRPTGFTAHVIARPIRRLADDDTNQHSAEADCISSLRIGLFRIHLPRKVERHPTNGSRQLIFAAFDRGLRHGVRIDPKFSQRTRCRARSNSLRAPHRAVQLPSPVVSLATYAIGRAGRFCDASAPARSERLPKGRIVMRCARNMP